MRRFLAGLLASALLVAVMAGQAKPAEKPQPAAAGQHDMLLPAQLKWGPPPPALPQNAQVAVLSGDPSKPGPFVIRAKFPDGYTVPPHWHPTDEYLTILSGTLLAGLGDKIDVKSMHALPPGGFARMPEKTNHYVRAKGETVIQVNAMGPFELTYVNAADDPRKKTTTK